MIGELELPAAGSCAREPGEDTVELELTAAEQLELSQAANAVPGSSEVKLGKPGHDSFVCRRTERIDFVSTLTFVALVLGVTAASGWHALVGQPTAPTVAIAVPVAPAPAPDVQPPGPVVQVKNPFDPAEVFELPAGTTESAARDAVGELLLQRARGRLRLGFAERHREYHVGAGGTPNPLRSVSPPGADTVTLTAAYARP
jgi:hypothetical protein